MGFPKHPAYPVTSHWHSFGPVLCEGVRFASHVQGLGAASAITADPQTSSHAPIARNKLDLWVSLRTDLGSAVLRGRRGSFQ